MKNRILSFLSALILLNTLTVTAFASHPVPDLSQNGSITFYMDLDDQPLNGGNLNLYKVGDIAVEDGDYSFCLIDELQGSNVVLNDVSDPLLAEALLNIAKDAQLQPITKRIEEGKAVFSDRPVGLYVVWQDDQDATEGYAPIRPFLISVPRFQDDAYILDVVADPKIPLETVPTETTPPSTPTPPDERLPQTGQLNWPIPVMTASGIILFFVGWILCAGRKRIEDEK